MNNNDQDFEAAVIELRRGRTQNRLKFAAFTLLVLMSFFFVLAVALTVGPAVRAMLNAG